MKINRREIHNPGSLDARQGSHSLQHGFLKLTTMRRIVTLQPQIEGDSDGLLRIETKVDRLRPLKRAQHQTAADKEHM